MAITSQQWATFRTHVKAQAKGSAIGTAYAGGPGKVDDLVALYNAQTGTKVWRSDIKTPELINAVVMSEFLANGFITAGKQPAMNLLLQLGSGGLDATNANVRTSFNTIWTGTTTLTNLTALAQRVCTLFESLYLTAAAPANVCDPAIYGHAVTRVEVGQALWDDQTNPL